jgi:glyoxalase family protein
VDILCSPDSLRGLAEVALFIILRLKTPDATTQLEVKTKLEKLNLNTTAVLDRNYFTSIYFREPGGVCLKWLRWSGFCVDEAPDHLGELLKLPQQFEQNRGAIEKAVVPVYIDIKIINRSSVHTPHCDSGLLIF